MIKVKGFKYRNDNDIFYFENHYENLGIWLNDIQNKVFTKNDVYLPARNEDGTFEQKYKDTFSGCIRYYENSRENYILIDLILDEDNKVLFSSGKRTNKGHISKIMMNILDELDDWRFDDYEYVE